MSVNIIRIIPKNGDDPITYLTFDDSGTVQFEQLCNENGYTIPEWDEDTDWYFDTDEIESSIEYIDGDQEI